MNIMNNPIPKCYNCIHFSSWYQAQTYWEPADSGWECNKEDSYLNVDYGQSDEELDNATEEELFTICASKCKSYELSTDWNIPDYDDSDYEYDNIGYEPNYLWIEE